MYPQQAQFTPFEEITGIISYRAAQVSSIKMGTVDRMLFCLSKSHLLPRAAAAFTMGKVVRFDTSEEEIELSRISSEWGRFGRLGHGRVRSL